MSCPGKKALITRFISRELTGPEREALESHLETCASCREELSAASSLERLLRGQALVPAPSGFGERVMRAVGLIAEEEAALEQVTSRIDRVRRRFTLWEDVFTAGALAGVVMFVGFLFTPVSHALAGALYQVSGFEILRTLLSALGVRGSEFNLTYLNPVLVLLSLTFGIAYTADLLRPRKLRAPISFR